MAYVAGFLTETEEHVLVSRGWTMEPSPHDLVSPSPPENPCRFRMVWVDSSMFEIMNGHRSDKRTTDNEKRGLPCQRSR